MFQTCYNFQAKPFQRSRDPKFLFSNRGHRRAVGHVMYGVHEGERFIVITGETGAGKPLLQTVVRCDRPSFSSDSFAAIYRHTGGIPRKINMRCDRLLLLGGMDEKHAFRDTEVGEVINELRQEFAPADLWFGQEGGG